MSQTTSPDQLRPHRFGAIGLLAASLRPIAVLLQPYRALMTGAVLVHVGIHLAAIAAATTGAILVGRAITGTPAAQLTPLIWVTLALLIPLGILGWLDTVVTHIMSFRLLHDLRLNLYARFRDLAPAHLLQRRSGDVARASIADVELLEIFTSHIAPPIVAALIVPSLALAALWVIHPILALLVLPFAIAVASVPSWLLQRANAQGQALRSELGDLGANVVDAVQGTREILTADAQTTVLQQIRTQHDRIRKLSIAHGRRSGIEQAATDAIVAAAAIAVFAVAAALVLNGAIARPLFPAALVLTAGAFAPLMSISATLREVAQVSAAADRIQALLQAVPHVADDEHAASPHPPAPAALKLDGVGFAYRDDLPAVLHDVSFDVHPGETLALVGQSGAGKSTCVNLLLRLWDTQAGTVSVCGHDVRTYRQDDLRALIAVVPQDIHLFHTAAAENLRLARPHATDTELHEAAALANASEFIEALPDGWQTTLGERGADLSGGQRQRLAIARALLRKAPILILDEAVSNLDAESEQAFHTALKQVAADATVLLIAHRPSTIKLADRIVVLEHGRVAETGTYAELTARDSALSRLLADNNTDNL